MATFEVTYMTGSGTVMHRREPVHFMRRARAGDIQAIRIPASYKGQQHLPGYFWMSCMNALVSYESRLEMTVLMQLDFNKAVHSVVAQPFTVHYPYNNKRYRHTPDFFVRYVDGNGEILNVKPQKYLNKEGNIRDFHAAEAVSHEMGFRYSTRSELNPVLLANLSWLAGYRRAVAGLHDFGQQVIDAALDPTPIQQIIHSVNGAVALTRPVLFHLLWKGILATDLYNRMTDQTLVWTPQLAQHR